MSYSFSVKAASKEEAKQKVAAELDRVVEGQPVHEKDRPQAEVTAGVFIDMLVDPREDEAVNVTVYGSLGWRTNGEDGPSDFTSANVSVSASIGSKD